jgi:hypothetical protein
MSDSLSQDALLVHIHALAAGIGPRPTAQAAEGAAHAYVRTVLQLSGITNIEAQAFPTRTTIASAVTYPLITALAGNILSLFGVTGKLVGGCASFFAGYNLWRLYGGQRLPIEFLEPRQQSNNLIVRIPAARPSRHTIVLIGHVDTSKKRALNDPRVRHLMLRFSTLWLFIMLLNGLSQLVQVAGLRWIARIIQWLSATFLASTLRQAWADERNPYVAGANDNATAVACLLGIGQYLRHHPLHSTDVWLVFTGAEEVGCVGMQHFLDKYGRSLQYASFIDFEMVGTERIAYVTRHSGLSYLNTYYPDHESLQWANETAKAHPHLHVSGQAMVMMEEIGTLRGQGYRGICIAGVGADGWLANWHQVSDTVENIVPSGVERAARFVLAMLRERDTI